MNFVLKLTEIESKRKMPAQQMIDDYSAEN